MRKGIVVIAVLAVCLGTAWADRPSPTKEDALQTVGQTPTRMSNPAPALPGRLQTAPLAAAPLDDGNVSAELGTGAAGSRGTDYYVSTTGSDSTGDGSAGSPWATIQHAIGQVTDTDTIHVAAGTYVETGQIVINKTLTIVGDPASKPVVKPAQDTGASGDARGWWLVNTGKDLTLQYLVLDGDSPTRKVYQAVRANGTVTVDTCELRNVKYSTYLGMGVVLFANGTVSNSTFSNMERIGVIAFGAGVTDALVYASTYAGKGAGDWLDYGVELGGGAVATVANNTITACTGVAASDGSTSAGLLITTYYGAGTAGTVLGNVLTGNTTAIAAGYDSADTSAVVAHYNDLSGCPKGIENTSSPLTVNGEKNWWGTTSATLIGGLVSGNVDYTPYLLTSKIRAAFAGNRLAATQNADGGWGWPLTGPTALNTVGPIAMGLVRAYEVTSDPDLYTALQKAGALLLTKTNNFSASDGYLAAELDRVFGGTTYVTHLNNNYYGPLAAGTYNRNGAGTLYSTATYVQLIRDNRASQGIPNLAAWDVGMGLVAAASCGVGGADRAAWIAGVEGEVNELEAGTYADPESYDVVGLAGALYGLAFVREEFDPTAGEHADAANLADLADILASYQIDASGGFTWNANWVIPYDYDEAVQETAYAILALAAVGGHDPEIQAAGNWLLSFQLATGGWMNYVGSTENNEVTAEGAWGVWQMAPEQLTLEADNECYSSGDTVTVEIWMHGISQNVVGGQFFLKYNQAKLAFASAVAGPAPFDNQLYEVVDPNNGTIDYSVYADAGDPGMSGDAKMAVLTFTALTELCGEADLIYWRPHNPPSRLSGGQGQGIYPALINLEVVDDTAPVITCPVDKTIECDELTDPSNTGYATAVDDCDPAPVITYADVVNLSGCGGYTGTITRTWRATDHCDNESTCVQVITINDVTPPAITCPTNKTIECDESIDPANAGTATAADNCDLSPVVTYADAPAPFVVTPTNKDGWDWFATESGSNTPGGDGVAEMVNGPGSPPLGFGSAHLNTGTDGSQSAQLRNSSWVGTRIDALTSFKYSTYATAWNGQQVPYLTIWVDTNGDGTFDDRLWFEPDYSSAGAGNGNPNPQDPTMLNVWQTWDCLIGMWYSDNHAGPGSNAITLPAYLVLEPDATIVNTPTGVGGIRVASGFASPGDVFNAYVDAFIIGTAAGTTTYDFELEESGCAERVIARIWTATDDCGNSSSCTQIITVQDNEVPVISGLTVNGGHVDAGCDFTVTFSAQVDDNCCVDADDVTVAVALTTGNATLGTPTITKIQVDTDTVSISGSVLVSDLTSCPATVQVTIHVNDCCDNAAAQVQGSANVNDVTAPVVTAPADINVNADAGLCTATVTWPAATASDNCDPTLPITYDIDLDNDGTVDTSQSGTTYTFSGGTHKVTARAMDACGNMGSGDFLVTVSASNELKVSVELDTPFTGSRCITFELWDCGPPVIGPVEKKQVLNFSGGTATAQVVLVPCDTYYECITARDTLHTLRTTVTPSIVGTQYVANFTGGDKLLGGNLNDDYWIDILDFGVFSWKYGTKYKDGVEVPGPDVNGNTTCSTASPHADISGDGLVTTNDFNWVRDSFLLTHEENCCGQPNFRGDAGPVTRISVADLIAQGLGELAAGDINGDGWLDEQDMADFLAGLPPPVALGDLNCDGAVDLGDINPFVMALTNPAAWQQAYPGCNLLNADLSGDGNVDFADINLFVALLSAN